MTDHETFLLLAARQVDEILSPDEAATLDAHLRVCPSCRSVAAGMRRDDIRLRAELAPAGVSPRVRRRVLDEAAGRRHIDPRLALGLAAALVLGAIGAPLLAGSRFASAPSSSVAPSAPSLAPSLAPTDPVAPSPSTASPSAVEAPPSPSPPGSSAFVAGAYTYGTSPPRSGTLAAHFEGGAAVGEWSRTYPNTGDGESFGGPVTCLVVTGSDAWLAGPATTATDGSTNLAALIYVHDGGLDGSGDRAMTWITQPGQTLATVTTWCKDRFTPAPAMELTSGDVVVQEAP